MAIIDAAVDERDLYAQKGLRFKKLKGKRGQRSLGLNDQWRLIVTVDEDNQGNYLTIIDIEDYH